MRFSFRQVPIVKSIAYAVICLCLLLFSYSFVPSLRVFDGTPILLVGAVCSLSLFEDIRYSTFIALIFSVVETVINGTNTLIYPFFYVMFAFLCKWLFENFFVKNFLTWACYTAGGIAIYLLISLFGHVSAWGIAAPSIIIYNVLPTFLISIIFSVPLFSLFFYVKRKTDTDK